MVFTVIIPARMASTRLPDKPLADLAGLPMVVRVARRAAQSSASRVVVAADDPRVLEACQTHGIEAVLTRRDHLSGSDRLAEACELLALEDQALVVNVQGDEPLVAPALIDEVAGVLAQRPEASMGTAAHALHDLAEFCDPNVVKVVMDTRQFALYFSRAPIPWSRDGAPAGLGSQREFAGAMRHVGLYAYRVGVLRRLTQLPPSGLEQREKLEQLRALHYGMQIRVADAACRPGPDVNTANDLARAALALQTSVR